MSALARSTRAARGLEPRARCRYTDAPAGGPALSIAVAGLSLGDGARAFEPVPRLLREVWRGPLPSLRGSVSVAFRRWGDARPIPWARAFDDCAAALAAVVELGVIESDGPVAIPRCPRVYLSTARDLRSQGFELALVEEGGALSPADLLAWGSLFSSL